MRSFFSKKRKICASPHKYPETMDLLLQEKNEILISRNFKIQALSQKAEICELRIRSLFLQ